MKQDFLLEVRANIPVARQYEIIDEIKKFSKFYGHISRKLSDEVRSEIVTLRFKHTLIGDFNIHQECEEMVDVESRLSAWLESKHRICVLSTKREKI